MSSCGNPLDRAETTEPRCYIGVWPACGCIRFVTTDEPKYAKDNAKEISRLMKAGYRVENITVAEFKGGARKFGCKDKNACLNPNTKNRKIPA